MVYRQWCEEQIKIKSCKCTCLSRLNTFYIINVKITNIKEMKIE